MVTLRMSSQMRFRFFDSRVDGVRQWPELYREYISGMNNLEESSAARASSDIRDLRFYNRYRKDD